MTFAASYTSDADRAIPDASTATRGAPTRPGTGLAVEALAGDVSAIQVWTPVTRAFT